MMVDYNNLFGSIARKEGETWLERGGGGEVRGEMETWG